MLTQLIIENIDCGSKQASHKKGSKIRASRDIGPGARKIFHVQSSIARTQRVLTVTICLGGDPGLYYDMAIDRGF